MDLYTGQCNTAFYDQRSKLLQSTLREQKTYYNIDQEYPIVLDPKTNEFSFCIVDQSTDKLIAHANYWPRTFTHNNHQTQHHILFCHQIKMYYPKLQRQKLLSEVSINIFS